MGLSPRKKENVYLECTIICFGYKHLPNELNVNVFMRIIGAMCGVYDSLEQTNNCLEDNNNITNHKDTQ